MNLQELQTLLDYHFWARDRLLEAVETLTTDQFTKDLGNSFPSIRDTVVHLYSADWIWCCRWEGSSPTAMLSPEEFPDVASIRNAWRQHEQRVRSLVENLGDAGIQRVVEYRAVNGRSNAQVFWQLVQHLVNHGAYHRGQVTTMMRQLKAGAPKSTDLVAFYRERAATHAG